MKSVFPKVIASLFVLSLLVTSCDDAPKKKPVRKAYSYNREQRQERKQYKPEKPRVNKYKKRCKCKKRRTRCCSVTTKMQIVR